MIGSQGQNLGLLCDGGIGCPTPRLEAHIAPSYPPWSWSGDNMSLGRMALLCGTGENKEDSFREYCIDSLFRRMYIVVCHHDRQLYVADYYYCMWRVSVDGHSKYVID